MDWSEQTKQAMSCCRCCPRACGADRLHGETGACGAGMLPAVVRAMPHFYEEPCISGTQGSGAVFFQGCSLHCIFCQNDSISRKVDAPALSLDAFCATLDGLIRRNVHNLNFVTPTHYAYQIADALRCLRPTIPVVWNTGGYESQETIDMIAPLVDIWLPDLKFPDDQTGMRYTAVRNYATVAFAAVRRMAELAGSAEYNDQQMMTHGLIIRHLCLPGMTTQSKHILQWIRQTLGADAAVSLMRQYFPAGAAKRDNIRPLNRKLRNDEYERVFDFMMNLGLINGYVQDAEAAEEGYVPDFNGAGVAEEIQ